MKPTALSSPVMGRNVQMINGKQVAALPVNPVLLERAIKTRRQWKIVSVLTGAAALGASLYLLIHLHSFFALLPLFSGIGFIALGAFSPSHPRITDKIIEEAPRCSSHHLQTRRSQVIYSPRSP